MGVWGCLPCGYPSPAAPWGRIGHKRTHHFSFGCGGGAGQHASSLYIEHVFKKDKKVLVIEKVKMHSNLYFVLMSAKPQETESTSTVKLVGDGDLAPYRLVGSGRCGGGQGRRPRRGCGREGREGCGGVVKCKGSLLYHSMIWKRHDHVILPWEVD
jgi:hypothetical protein